MKKTSFAKKLIILLIYTGVVMLGAIKTDSYEIIGGKLSESATKMIWIFF
jgi:hypothetical protein